jgi:hypothetical protein
MNQPPQFGIGGFAAMSHPSSYHNKFARKIRQWTMARGIEDVFTEYISKYRPQGQRLQQIMDRMMLRPVGKSPPQTWHRDQCIKIEDEDFVFGGWVNFDSTDQYFTCIPGSHSVRPTGQGYTPLRESDLQKLNASKLTVDAVVPPGHLIIFFEHIAHRIRKYTRTTPMYRMFIGWRTTSSEHPVYFEDRAHLEQSLAKQAAMLTKSGELAPMYRPLNWTNGRKNLVEFCKKHVHPNCLVDREMKSGQHKGKKFKVVDLYMTSLEEYGLPKYEEYSKEEVDLLCPGTEFTLLKPGSDTETDTYSTRP